MRRMLHLARAILLVVALAFVAGCASLSQQRDHAQRAELLALLQTLNADLLSHDSATLTLEHWCADHRLAEPARIVAQRAHGPAKAIPEDLRARLSIDAAEPIAYRHVQLMCGDHVLSEADNWYVPGRLTAAMNEQLENSDEPFGKVVKPLGFRRQTLTAELLWSPLPAHWEMITAPPAREPLRIPHFVLRHQAVLYSSAQQPFSVVVESYTHALFDFRRWDMPR